MNPEADNSRESRIWSEWIKDNLSGTFHESPQLHRSWLKRLKEEVANILIQRKISLRPPAIRVDSAIKRWGLWHKSQRTIYLSRWLMLTSDWDAIVETLKHELAHMLSIELFNATYETAHGPSFKKACDLLGISSRASASDADIGLPLNQKNTSAGNTEVIQKIQKLLKLSESSNKHEAELALLKANQLLLKNNLNRSELKESADIHYKTFGKLRKRFPMEEILVLNILSEFFLVDYIIVPVYKPLTDQVMYAAEVYGLKENIPFADYVYDFIRNRSEKEWVSYKTKHRLKGISLKKCFLSGYLTGFRNTLAANRTEKNYALMVSSQSLEIKKYIKKRYPRVRTASRRSSNSSASVYHDAHKKGGNLKIKNPINALKRLLICGA